MEMIFPSLWGTHNYLRYSIQKRTSVETRPYQTHALEASITPTVVPMNRLTSLARSLAINSAFCSKVVTYRLAFTPATIDLPISGICFIHEFCHAGGNVALVITLLCNKAFVGTPRSADSAVRSPGQSKDQSTVFDGRDLSSAKFWRCSR